MSGAVLVTGGAGFIGTNLAARLLSRGESVLVFDNLSRAGVEHNLAWLRAHAATTSGHLQVCVGDVRDAVRLGEAVAAARCVFHFAAQVAVTTSLQDPLNDFDVNLRGTLNLLEAVRSRSLPPPLVFTSTNKVYGALEDVALETGAQRHQPRSAALRGSGISEQRALDFHSPYGCSKGAADQYVLDYARSYGVPATVLRMSCIYGPHQFGNEDQGWVAHFLLRALQSRAITLYGDGRQVRDVLYVDDLVEALLLCREHIGALQGRAFNMGGGPGNTTSLLELLSRIGELSGHAPAIRTEPARTGDQRWYVSDTRSFARATGWKPRVGLGQGVAQLRQWLLQHRIELAPAQERIHAA